jgi:hypothetical protein
MCSPYMGLATIRGVIVPCAEIFLLFELDEQCGPKLCLGEVARGAAIADHLHLCVSFFVSFIRSQFTLHGSRNVLQFDPFVAFTQYRVYGQLTGSYRHLPRFVVRNGVLDRMRGGASGLARNSDRGQSRKDVPHARTLPGSFFPQLALRRSRHPFSISIPPPNLVVRSASSCDAVPYRLTQACLLPVMAWRPGHMDMHTRLLARARPLVTISL